MSSMNDKRASRAEAALEAYILARGEVFEASPYEAADLIADLLHLTDRMAEAWDIGTDATIDLARAHYDAETSGEEDVNE